MKKFIFTLCVLFMAGVPSGALAQFVVNSELIGTWKFKSAKIVKENDKTEVKQSDEVKKNLFYGLIDQFVFSEKDLTVVFDGYQSTIIDPRITGDTISMSSMPVPFAWQYKIKNGALLLERRVDYLWEGQPGYATYRISTKYTKQ